MFLNYFELPTHNPDSVIIDDLQLFFGKNWMKIACNPTILAGRFL